MTTVSALVTQISSNLHSFTGVTEATTYVISNPIGPTDTNIFVQHPERVQQGFIEIDDELIQISVNSDGLLNVFPLFGRGAQGSVAASHVLNSRVTNDPMFPRVRIFDALKRAILQVQPDLYAITTDVSNITSPVVNTYPIPAGVLRVLNVQYQVIGPTQEWIRVPAWTVDMDADTGTFPSGKSITIATPMEPGRPLQITYATPYVTPTAMTDDLESTCKIPASVHDVLLYNVAWQMTQFMEPYRLQMMAVEQEARAQGVTPGAASKTAQQFYAMYELRKREERSRLLTTYPTQMHYAVR